MSGRRASAALIGSHAISAAGEGAAAHAAFLGTLPPPPQWIELPTSAGEVELRPYRLVAEEGRCRNGDERVMAVVEETLRQGGLSPEARSACALLVGSSGSTLPDAEQRWASERRRNDFIPLDTPHGLGELVELIARGAGLRGPRYFVGTACSSSANALLLGSQLVAQGRVPAALIVGVDWYNQLTLRGFDALMLLDSQLARPFDQRRQGLLLGEGAAALLLVRADHPRWSVRGGATLGDSTNPTQSGACKIAQVMRAGLQRSQTSIEEIGAIKAHGTATPMNDRAEGQAIADLFGSRPPPVTSLKASLGHTLGACGALETAALLACLDRGLWPATPHCEQPDPECRVQPTQVPQSLSDGCFLLNFFGFGGNNCTLVVERSDAA
ncbi:hypothetical protein CKO15_10230 [Halorhodospira abdelmalekii]|uniref:beta-ketoacyl synthase N-terminal-like domain-containing protein n=1 Tax=Halorhodospira abdelmalekii TaxID=421629 RepID=UPI0019069732|nr:beta-ketoacyl synthase N-terminal-like domain-containing protein [Halorhodospira abdelmalekii]MBK1735653.1 hypothetical protein [Halorhodospira abdelmalekii]